MGEEKDKAGWKIRLTVDVFDENNERVYHSPNDFLGYNRVSANLFLTNGTRSVLDFLDQVTNALKAESAAVAPVPKK